MAFVPYMVGGYAVDKLMGGDGTKGALLGAGGSFLPSMLASGAGAAGGASAAATTGAATTAASNTMPLLMSKSAAMGGSGAGLGSSLTGLSGYGTVNPLTTGSFSESISPFTQLGSPVGQSTGFFGQEISNQAMNSALTGGKGLLETGLENTLIDDGLGYLGRGKDFIDEGWADMTTSDKMGSVNMANQAVEAQTQAQDMIVPPPRPIERRNPNPTPSAPLVTQVQGLQQMAPQQMMGQLSPEDQMKYYSLLNSGQ